MREDLRAASRPLGVIQRFLWHQQLRKVEPSLDPSEAVQILAPGWWRGQRTIAVVTTSRLLLVRNELKRSPSDQAAFTLGSISQLNVHTAPPDGARLRLMLGLNLEEFTITQRGTEFTRALRAALP